MFLQSIPKVWGFVSCTSPFSSNSVSTEYSAGFRTHFESGYRLAQTGANDEMKCSDSTCCQSEHKGSRFKQIKDLVFGKTQVIITQ